MKRLLGLYREKQYSPGRHRSNDVLLLDEIAGHLRKCGFAVELATLPEAPDHREDVAMIFSMCQGRASLENLLRWENEGMRIMNSPEAALNTYRDRLPKLMTEARIPFPETRLLQTGEAIGLQSFDGDGLWLKRGDVHASVAADVQWIESREQLESGFKDFAERGIEIGALQEHRAGDEIKFYGIADDAFFHWFYSRESCAYPFSFAGLQELTRRAAAAAGLDIYGGDVIVSPTGELTLIDLNDWPSFAPCRERASRAIAEFIVRRVHAS